MTACLGPALVLVVPSKRLFSRSRSAWRNALEQIHQTTRAQAQTAMADEQKHHAQTSTTSSNRSARNRMPAASSFS